MFCKYCGEEVKPFGSSGYLVTVKGNSRTCYGSPDKTNKKHVLSASTLKNCKHCGEEVKPFGSNGYLVTVKGNSRTCYGSPKKDKKHELV